MSPRESSYQSLRRHVEALGRKRVRKLFSMPGIRCWPSIIPSLISFRDSSPSKASIITSIASIPQELPRRPPQAGQRVTSRGKNRANNAAQEIRGGRSTQRAKPQATAGRARPGFDDFFSLNYTLSRILLMNYHRVCKHDQ